MTCLIKNVKIKEQSTSSGTLVATWDFTPPAGYAASTLDHYGTNWYYVGADGVAYEGGYKEDDEKYSTFTVPDGTYYVDFHCVPSAKTHKVNNNDVYYWTSETSVTRYFVTSMRAGAVSTPTVSISGTALTASLTNIEDYATSRISKVQFEVYKDNVLFSSAKVEVSSTRSATFKCTVQTGGKYKVRARGINSVLYQNLTGEWSDFSDEYSTVPSAPAGITACRAESSTSVYLEWAPVTTATKYTIEYTTSLSYFDASSEVKSVTTDEGKNVTHYYVTGLDTGQTWFFRVKAVNAQGDSGFTDTKSVTLGTTPTAPTTWSSNSTAVVGEGVNLYWVHNDEDGSTETYAKLTLTVETSGGAATWSQTIKKTDSDETSAYMLDTSPYADGTTIYWAAATSGVTNTFGPASATRTITVHAQPSLNLVLKDSDSAAIDTLTSYPLLVTSQASPSTQHIVSAHVEIVSDSSYTTTNAYGEEVQISAGETVYSKHLNSDNLTNTRDYAGADICWLISPSDVTFANGQSYTVTVTAAMDSGLSCDSSAQFDTYFGASAYDLGASIGIDDNEWTAYVIPAVYGDNTDCALAVYRREFDGTFKLIADGIEPTVDVAVVDPHPALDYARYRIIAVDNSTGAIDYYDVPNYPVGCKWAIIQWGEKWRTFSGGDDVVLADRPYAGSMLLLKYNHETSYDTSVKVETVQYAGREYPVSYYGDATSTTVSWSMDIPRDDAETIYQLRRLQVYHGDVYVRDPTGYGSYAAIEVNFSRSYDSAKIPVSIAITRVDDGGQA